MCETRLKYTFQHLSFSKTFHQNKCYLYTCYKQKLQLIYLQQAYGFLHFSPAAYLVFILFPILSLSIFRWKATCAASHDYVGNIRPVAKFRFTIKISWVSDFAKNIWGGWIYYKYFCYGICLSTNVYDCMIVIKHGNAWNARDTEVKSKI